MTIEVGGDDSHLSDVCHELNFKHSLVSEGNHMRALALRALEHSAGVLDKVAATYRGLANRPGGELEHARWSAFADRAAARAVRAHELSTALSSNPIEPGRQ